MSAPGPKCNYPARRRRLSFWGKQRVSCGRACTWRISFWGPREDVKGKPSMTVYRCPDHRESDVGLRVLSELVREERL